tara:strand:+ start:12 stop:764 length:753 start_codon:yes stop_codon:yes gene_type:complete
MKIKPLIVDSAENKVIEVAVDAIAGLPDGAYVLDNVIKTVGQKTFTFKRDQMKIYIDNRFMFAFLDDQTNKIDAAAGYAVWTQGVLTETPIANQDGPLGGLNFEVAISPTEAGFTQSVKGMPSAAGSYDLDEVWNTLGTDKGPFDGLWMLEKRASDENERSNFAEMKLIGGGHFIFFQRFDHKGESIQHFAFGSLQIDKSGRVTETGMTSTLEGYPAKEQLLNMQLVDAEHLTQIFLVDGVEVVQSYIRL